jgi:hypothetical protein
MARPILPDDLWKRLEPLIPKPKENRYVQFAGRKPSEPRGLSPASSSPCGRVSRGDGCLPPRISLPASPACVVFGSGRRPGFGNVFLQPCLRSSRLPTRSIGIGHWWTALRCALPAEAQKPAQIPRIGASWEASTICSPMPTASLWPLS